MGREPRLRAPMAASIPLLHRAPSWNENKYKKDKGIEDKQKKANCCQNTHWRKRNRTSERILLQGSMITSDAKCHREIKRRIAIGKGAF